MLRIKRFGLIAGLMAALASGLVVASPEHNATKTIPDSSDVVSATIALSPPGLMTRAPLTEKQVLEFGCNSTDDENEISDLLGMLKETVQDDAEKVGRFYLRNVIYLTLRNGSKTVYTFSDAIHQGDKIYGRVAGGGENSGVLFVAGSNLLVDLRKWILDHPSRKRDVKWCVEIVSN